MSAIQAERCVRPGKGLERVEHGGQSKAGRLAERESRQGVGRIVQARDLHARDIEQRLAAARQQGLCAPAAAA